MKKCYLRALLKTIFYKNLTQRIRNVRREPAYRQAGIEVFRSALKNRIALITGSSRGIGASTAKLFAQHGASVAVNYNKSEDAANRVVEEIVSKGGKAIAVKADVTDFNEVKNMYIISVSSGLSKKPGSGFIALSAAKAALNMMSSSLSHEVGQYGISVNAIAPGLTLTDATSRQPEERRRKSADANPMKRIGQPDDLAGAILLLASDYAGYITGGYILVDGGTTIL